MCPELGRTGLKSGVGGLSLTLFQTLRRASPALPVIFPYTALSGGKVEEEAEACPICAIHLLLALSNELETPTWCWGGEGKVCSTELSLPKL